MDSNTLLWITTIVMLLGGLAIFAKGKRRTSSEGLHTVLHGTICIIAACSYFAMATGQGLVLLPTVASGGTRIFYYARYVDWTFTTPLLLISLAMTAMHSGPKRSSLIAGAVIADLLMIVAAFAFGASEVGWMKWTWFLISCVAFLGVYYVIWVSQLEANGSERDDIRSSYRRNAMVLSALWLVYPFILAVSNDGLNIVSDSFGVLVIAIIDVLSKVAYGLMTTSSDEKATDRDLAENGRVGSMAAAD